MNTRNARYLARNESRCCTGNYRKLLVQTGAGGFLRCLAGISG